MGQHCARAFPVLQEGDGPQGHEDAEEDRATMVKEYAQLQGAETQSV